MSENEVRSSKPHVSPRNMPKKSNKNWQNQLSKNSENLGKGLQQPSQCWIKENQLKEWESSMMFDLPFL